MIFCYFSGNDEKVEIQKLGEQNARKFLENLMQGYMIIAKDNSQEEEKERNRR